MEIHGIGLRTELLVLDDKVEWRRCVDIAHREAARRCRALRLSENVVGELAQEVILELRRELARVVIKNGVARATSAGSGREALIDAGRVYADGFPDEANEAARQRLMALVRLFAHTFATSVRTELADQFPAVLRRRDFAARVRAHLEQRMTTHLPHTSLTPAFRSRLLDLAWLDGAPDVIDVRGRDRFLGKLEAALAATLHEIEREVGGCDKLVEPEYASARFRDAAARFRDFRITQANVRHPVDPIGISGDPVTWTIADVVDNCLPSTLVAEQVVRRLVAVRSANLKRDIARGEHKLSGLSATETDMLVRPSEREPTDAIEPDTRDEHAVGASDFGADVARDVWKRLSRTYAHLPEVKEILGSKDGQVLCRYAADEGLAEIAASLKESIANVHRRKTRACRQLLECLDDEDRVAVVKWIMRDGIVKWVTRDGR